MAEEKERLTAIFTLNGIKKTNQIKINHINNMGLLQHQYVADTLLEQYDIFDDNDNDNNDNVQGELFQCNITDLFLMTSKKLPMMYVNVIYEKPLQKILLFRIYLFFTIEADIKDVKQLLLKPITGKFSFELAINDQKKIIDDDLGIYIGDGRMQKKMVNFTKVDDMKVLIKSLMEEVDEKFREQYKEEFDLYKIPTNIISLKDYPLNDNESQ